MASDGSKRFDKDSLAEYWEKVKGKELSLATSSSAGLMSAADKALLDNMQARIDSLPEAGTFSAIYTMEVSPDNTSPRMLIPDGRNADYIFIAVFDSNAELVAGVQQDIQKSMVTPIITLLATDDGKSYGDDYQALSLGEAAGNYDGAGGAAEDLQIYVNGYTSGTRWGNYFTVAATVQSSSLNPSFTLSEQRLTANTATHSVGDYAFYYEQFTHIKGVVSADHGSSDPAPTNDEKALFYPRAVGASLQVDYGTDHDITLVEADFGKLAVEMDNTQELGGEYGYYAAPATYTNTGLNTKYVYGQIIAAHYEIERVGGESAHPNYLYNTVSITSTNSEAVETIEYWTGSFSPDSYLWIYEDGFCLIGKEQLSSMGENLTSMTGSYWVYRTVWVLLDVKVAWVNNGTSSSPDGTLTIEITHRLDSGTSGSRTSNLVIQLGAE